MDLDCVWSFGLACSRCGCGYEPSTSVYEDADADADEQRRRCTGLHLLLGGLRGTVRPDGLRGTVRPDGLRGTVRPDDLPLLLGGLRLRCRFRMALVCCGGCS